MKVKKTSWFFIFILISLSATVFGALSKTTEELFYEYLSGGAGIQRHISEWSIEYAPLWMLRKKSIAPEKSLIVSAINVSEVVEIYNEAVLLKLTDLLIYKGEDVGLLKNEPCHFFDQLIMKGSFGLVEHILSRGASMPSGSGNTCATDMGVVLHDYKNRYSEEEYIELIRLFKYSAKQ